MITKEQKIRKIRNIRMALARIQSDIQIIEENDVFGLNLINNFRDDNGILITSDMFTIAKEKEKQIMREPND